MYGKGRAVTTRKLGEHQWASGLNIGALRSFAPLPCEPPALLRRRRCHTHLSAVPLGRPAQGERCVTIGVWPPNCAHALDRRSPRLWLRTMSGRRLLLSISGGPTEQGATRDVGLLGDVGQDWRIQAMCDGCSSIPNLHRYTPSRFRRPTHMQLAIGPKINTRDCELLRLKRPD